jgi:hypothetical protein
MRLREAKAFWGVDELQAHLAAVEAERDAARAGEARAVEALKAAYGAAEEWHGSVEWEGREHTQAVIDACNAVLARAQPPLAWLAQQRAEAAAEALEAFADDAGGIEELRACNISDLRSRLRARAAALRAGEVGND